MTAAPDPSRLRMMIHRTEQSAQHRHSAAHPAAVNRIAVGVDGYPEGRDAVALGVAFARATGAELMLVAVHPDPLVVLPKGMDWKGMHEQARATLAEARDASAPDARIAVETDLSVARALHRVVRREHRDLLVVGSSRHAEEGRVRIGKRTRQLLCHFECALAVAPRGMHANPEVEFTRIGVGYDGSPESEAALALGGAVAVAADAELHVLGVVDDRMPTNGWSSVWLGEMTTEWQAIVREELGSLRKHAAEAAHRTGASVETQAVPGRPADALLQLSGDVDLLVIGSRRWGPAARVLLGSTGEAVLHDAACPVLAVPRPAS